MVLPEGFKKEYGKCVRCGGKVPIGQEAGPKKRSRKPAIIVVVTCVLAGAATLAFIMASQGVSNATSQQLASNIDTRTAEYLDRLYREAENPYQPLWFLASWGNRKDLLLPYFKRFALDPDGKIPSNGMPILSLAADSESTADFLIYLLDCGANTEVEHGGPLRRAAQAGNHDGILILLDHGANPNLLNPMHDMTAAGYALMSNQYVSARILLENGGKLVSNDSDYFDYIPDGIPWFPASQYQEAMQTRIEIDKLPSMEDCKRLEAAIQTMANEI
jgi:hypothetical protein